MTVKTQPYIAKTSLRGKFMVIQAFLKKQEKSQINNLTYHLKELEKEQQQQQKKTKQTHPKVSRRKEIIKIRAQVLLIFSIAF